MIRSLISRLFSTPPGGSTDVSFACEGLRWQWALLALALLGTLALWSYRWGAANLSRTKRGILSVLRIFLIAAFLFLLVKPVVLLTVNEPVREKLIVLLDTTQSMEIKDRRRSEEDQNRARLAAGLLSPSGGLKQPAPRETAQVQDVCRAELLKALAANDKLRLWPRLQERADLFFYAAGRTARPIGPMARAGGDSEKSVSVEESKAFFEKITYSDNATALGDSLRQALDENRGQPVSGVFLITDGGNNSGTPPEEIADLAKQDGVPLYLYGVGITAPKDLAVHELSGPSGAFVKERAAFSVKVRASGFTGRHATLQLKANGKKVDEKEITFGCDGDTEYQLGFEPEEKGECQVEASIDPLEDEAARDNNSATTKIRVLDRKVKVLYVEQYPRWDFRYLLAALERDRRIEVKVVLFDGGEEMADGTDPAYLKEFPANRGDVVSNEIIILGDVDPKELGETRMKLIDEWVGEMGGGLIFLAGRKFNPIGYKGTPLEALLPVDIAGGDEKWGESSREPVRLKLTPSGELSSLLRLSENTLENRRLWNDFPGVRWTARVSRARPTAQVFLVATQPDSMPVIAQEQYGQGMVMYFGSDETYRWRSQVGEKYYAQIWNQVIQSFSLERQLGASARTQLKVERPEYLAGDRVVISGKIYTPNFTPLIEASVAGILTVLPPDGKGTGEKLELRLIGSPQHPGEYQLEFTPKLPGEYRFSTVMDPQAVVKFEVVVPKLEQAETAMNAALLQSMADISGGKFLREEDLDTLPNLVSSHSATVPIFKKLELFYSPWWMVALMSIAALEWLLRRLWQLK